MLWPLGETREDVKHCPRAIRASVNIITCDIEQFQVGDGKTNVFAPQSQRCKGHNPGTETRPDFIQYSIIVKYRGQARVRRVNSPGWQEWWPRAPANVIWTSFFTIIMGDYLISLGFVHHNPNNPSSITRGKSRIIISHIHRRERPDRLFVFFYDSLSVLFCQPVCLLSFAQSISFNSSFR